MADDIVTRLRALSEEWWECCNNIHLPLIDAADEIEYLRQICEELMHAIECPNPACTLDWDGIHNWHDYRDQLAGRNKDNQ